MKTNAKFEHGGNIHKAKRDKNTKLIDFSANINSLGLSVAVEAKIKASIDEIIHYPDPDCYELKKLLGQCYSIPKKYITIGNGAVELLYIFCNILKPKNVMIMAPSFCEYERAALASAAKINYHYLEVKNDFKLKVSELINKLDGNDIVFLCNPNNPTGTILKYQEIDSILAVAKAKNIVIFVDESFIDFIENNQEYTCRQLIQQYDNLVILHSLTKFYAIPGLRLGFMLANSDLTQKMHLAKDPWNVNVLAQVAGVAALKDKEYQKQSIENLNYTKSLFYDKLKSIEKLKVYPPTVNYIFIDIKNTGYTARELQELLLKDNILIRNCENYPGLSEYYIRLAIKDEKNNNLLINYLQKIIGD